MKLGFVSAILDQMSFEEMIDTAAGLGFSCMEVACWPRGKAERRYVGVSYIDVGALTDKEAVRILDYCKAHRVEISSLAYYSNTTDDDLEKHTANIAHLRQVIAASHRLGVNLVIALVGRDQTKTVEENLGLFREIWPLIIQEAEGFGVRIVIENCPILFGPDQWPGGQNLASTPAIWRELLQIVPSPNFGLNYDPSHFIRQMMDYITPLYEFKDRIFYVHFKGIKLLPDRLHEVGTMAYPPEYMVPKLPGLGDVDWGKYASALTDVSYNGYARIEIEDKAFGGNQERILNSLRISKWYMQQFVI